MGNMTNLGFNAANVDPAVGFDPIPAGTYTVLIMDSDIKETKAGTGRYIETQMEVIEGAHKGRYLWARFNVANPSAKAVEIGMAELSSLCRAVGVLTPNDTIELHNKPFDVKVAVVPRSDTGELTNDVKGFYGTNTTAQPMPTNPMDAPATTAAPDLTPPADKSDGLPF